MVLMKGSLGTKLHKTLRVLSVLCFIVTAFKRLPDNEGVLSASVPSILQFR